MTGAFDEHGAAPTSSTRCVEELDARSSGDRDAAATPTLARARRRAARARRRAGRRAPDFVADLRERLMAEADTVLLVPPTTPSRASAARARRTGAASAGSPPSSAASPSSARPTSMAVAAQTALPGESLYPVKRAIENAADQPRSPTTRPRAHRCSPSHRPARRGRAAQPPSGAGATRRSPDPRHVHRAGDRRRPTCCSTDYADTGDEDRSPSCATSPPTSIDQLAQLERAGARRGPRRAARTPRRTLAEIDAEASTSRARPAAAAIDRDPAGRCWPAGPASTEPASTPAQPPAPAADRQASRPTGRTHGPRRRRRRTRR